MVKFVDVNPADIELPTSGSMSKDILDGFMDRNNKVCKVDLEELGRDMARVRPVLTSYAKNHKLPVKLFSRNGELYLMRLDLDEKNKPIPWEPESDNGEGDGR